MPSPQENLQNLVKIGKLKTEPPDQSEFNGLVRSAERRLRDAQTEGLSPDGRFSLTYDAAHSIALAALRWHGYRSENRFLVFQVLEHTLNFPSHKWRLLDNCHQKRNLALYEGEYAEDEQLITELIAVTKELMAAVAGLGKISG